MVKAAQTASEISANKPLTCTDSISHPSKNHWFALKVPEKREFFMAQKCLKIGETEGVSECIAPRREKLLKVGGVWRTEIKPMFDGYIFAAAPSAEVLEQAIKQVSGVCLASITPLDESAQAWLTSALDSSGVFRASEGRIEQGELTVTREPLQGREAYVRKIDRRKRQALVRLGRGDQAFSFLVALSVPVKE